MQQVIGAIQHYAWGDDRFIPELLGKQPDGRPWAELWLGTHPNGPTLLADGTPLETVSGKLPYLLKVLSAAEPLSLQTHPSTAQAIDGYRRGVYPDDRAKPELLYALTPFVALCGVRPPEATIRLLNDFGLVEFSERVESRGVAATLHDLYRGRWAPDIDPAAFTSNTAAPHRLEARWYADLAARYRGEPSVAAAMLLNLVELAPGEVLSLEPGNLHAYLHGSGIELMGASDNVVRGGLTVKHVDVDELLRVLDPQPLTKPVVTPAARYQLPSAGVELAIAQPGDRHLAADHQLAVDMAGGTWWYQPGDTVDIGVTTFIARRIATSLSPPQRGERTEASAD